MKGRRFIAALLLLAAVLVFWPVTRFDFVRWDDQINVYENPYLNPVTVEHLAHFWTRTTMATTQPDLPTLHVYRPVTYTAWAALAALSQWSQPHRAQLNPHIFHTANLLVHLLNVWLVFALLCLLLRREVPAAAGAALFGLHPVQVEAVAWVTGLNDVLSTLFALLSLWCLFRFTLPAAGKPTTAGDETEPVASKPTLLLSYVPATLCFVLALLAKPAAVTLPLMAWAIDVWQRRQPRRSFLILSPWLLISVAAVLLARVAEPESRRIFSPLWERPFIAADALAFYLGKLVWPWQLAPDYGRTPAAILASGAVYWTWIVPAAALLLIWRGSRRHPWLPTAAMIFVAGLLPVLGLVPFRFQNTSTVADRYLYLPMLGISLGLATALARTRLSGWRWRRAVGVTALLLLALGASSALQTQHWRDTFALFHHSLMVNPTSWKAQFNVGTALLERQRYREAARHFKTLTELKPDYAGGWAYLAHADAKTGQWQEAHASFQKALQLQPDYADAHVGLGNLAAHQGDLIRAITEYQAALRLDPNLAGAHYNLALALEEQGHNEQARQHLEVALRLHPDAETHNALALALARENRLEKAATHWQAALRLNPDYAEARINYGVLLAMQGNGDGAVEQWQAALKIAPDNAELHHNLATLLMKQGQKEKAIAHWKQALKLKTDYPEAKQALEEAEKNE